MTKQLLIMSAVTLGIHLGTTNYCVAVYLNDKVEIIASHIGTTTSPRFDPNDYNNGPFQVVGGSKDHSPPKMLNGKALRPDIVSVEILSYLKEKAEDYLSTKVQNAVVAVPANFNDAEQKKTRDAGIEAGFTNIRVINEPTGAAIAYNLQRKSSDAKIDLVFNLDQNKLDVTILKFEESFVKTLEVGGNPHFGRENFVNAFFQDCVARLTISDNNSRGLPFGSMRWDPKPHPVSQQIEGLKDQCEEKTVELLTAQTVHVTLRDPCKNIEVTREVFEYVNRKSFEKCIDSLDRAIKNTKLTKYDIDQVILVGYSSKIPTTQTKISNYFNGKKPLDTIEGFEAIAYGAAIEASNFFRIENEPKKLYEQQLAQLEDKVCKLFHQRGWEFDEDMVAELHNWLQYRDL